ncbi:MAG TPA: zinc ribbon domain-containing protein [Candidatus Binataceae bacterium]|nr:zinc ribbon domain-containing protein [Candidatus Binataceae bacterium]
MPIYEYRCSDCQSSFETLVRPGHDDDAECPSCHSIRLTREMSVFAAHNGAADGAAAAENMIAANGTRTGGGCCGGGCGCH